MHEKQRAEAIAAEIIALCHRKDEQGKRVYGRDAVLEVIPFLFWHGSSREKRVVVPAKLRPILAAALAEFGGRASFSREDFDNVIATHYAKNRPKSALFDEVKRFIKRLRREIAAGGVDVRRYDAVLGLAPAPRAVQEPPAEGTVRGGPLAIAKLQSA